MKNFTCIIGFLFLLVACKTRTANSSTVPKDLNDIKSLRDVVATISTPQNFGQVKMNAKISVQMDKFVPPIEAVFYIEQNQKIWMNANALFFNVARGIATPEGIKGYEKWNKTYIESDFSYLNRLLNVNFINFESLQNLLIGKSIFPINDTNYILYKTTTGFTAESKDSQVVSINGKPVEYKIKLEYNSILDLSKVTLSDLKNSNNQLEIDYSQWSQEGQYRFPKNVEIIIKGKKNGQILIENTIFDFEKMDVPYRVPPNYKKTEIK